MYYTLFRHIIHLILYIRIDAGFHADVSLSIYPVHISTHYVCVFSTASQAPGKYHHHFLFFFAQSFPFSHKPYTPHKISNGMYVSYRDTYIWTNTLYTQMDGCVYTYYIDIRVVYLNIK